jgi:hypothetical protein
MGLRLNKLLSIASAPVSAASIEIPTSAGTLGEELAEVLSRCNGFYAFESALHVRASGLSRDEPTLEEWNANDLWRSAFGAMAEGHLFFAEDVFGGQFSIKDDHVFTFDPETGQATPLAKNLEEWADHMLFDYEVLTGFPLAHEWQQIHGSLRAGQRLVPKRPFVLGGQFSVENLYDMEAAASMRYRAEIAMQIRSLPEGATVTLRAED